ncbi:MAG TPA: AAA family ATPase [Candidatus Acidoferrales bacterium]|nr:AAA family ATPase [Candidatus Acidoferrales bacterium]
MEIFDLDESMEIEVVIKNYRCFPDSEPARLILAKGFTALVGVNNSGKSSLLRFFYELRLLFEASGKDPATLVAALQLNPRGLRLPDSVSDANEIFNNRNTRNLEINLRLLGDVATADPGGATELHFTLKRDTHQWIADIPRLYSAAETRSLSVDPQGNLKTPQRRIVNLRLIQEVCRQLSDVLYIGPFRNAINVGGDSNYYDIKVGQPFIAEWKTLKTGPIIEKNVAILKLTDGIRRIFECEQLEIDASSDEKNLKVFVNNKSFRLTELGAGLSQFILVLANAAIRRPEMILIDEPELNLHPSLQIDFLTTLASYCRGGVVFATHSIGLARAAASRIYSLRRLEEGKSELRDFEGTPNLAEFVGELGFSGYHELGYDRILLVEGPTDVTTFQQFLRMFQKDHKVVILPLGGNSLINASVGPQLSELHRISTKITAVIDSEKRNAADPLSASREGFVEACRSAFIECKVLARRATENYLTERAVKAALGESHRALSEFETLGSVTPSWSKNENWRIAREMRKEDLDGTDLGPILDSL